jgi:hypothetical protein
MKAHVCTLIVIVYYIHRPLMVYYTPPGVHVLNSQHKTHVDPTADANAQGHWR